MPIINIKDFPCFLWPVYYISLFTSITAPQDAHKRLVMQVAEWVTASLYQCSREVSDMS